MKNKGINRRRFIAACGVVGIAGCISRDQPANDGSGKDENQKGNQSREGDQKESQDDGDKASSEDSNQGADFNYRDWLVNPDEVQGYSHDGYSFFRADFSRIIENQDKLSEEAMGFMESSRNTLKKRYGFGFEDIDEMVSWGVATTFDLSISSDEVLNNLRDSDGKVEKIGNHGGYTLYSYSRSSTTSSGQSNFETVLGMKGSTIVGAGSNSRNVDLETSKEYVKKTIDTGEGQLKRFPETNSDFALLTDKIDSGVVMNVRYTFGEGSLSSWSLSESKVVGTGMYWKFGDGHIDFNTVMLFDSEVGPSTAEKWKKKVQKNIETVSDIRTTTDGRTATLEIDLKKSEMKNIFYPTLSVSMGSSSNSESGSGSESSSEGGERVPQVRFEFEQDGKAGESGSTLRVLHAGGDVIDNTDGDALTLQLGKKEAPSQFPGKRIAAGDSVTINISDASTGQRVRVIWQSDESVVLAEYRLE